jgi:hypothetical protein
MPANIVKRLLGDSRTWGIFIRVTAVLLFACGCSNAWIGFRYLYLPRSLPSSADELLMMIGFSLPAFGLAALKMTAGTMNVFYRCRALGLVAIASLVLDAVLWHTYWTAIPLLICGLAVYLSYQGANRFAQHRSISTYYFTAGFLGVGAFVLLVPGTIVLLMLMQWHLPLPDWVEKAIFTMFMLPPIPYLPNFLIQGPGHIPIPTPLGAFLVYHCPGILLLVLAAMSRQQGRRLADATGPKQGRGLTPT